MTLYEEAGLSRQATAEEVRQAYHNFVRLLHPDTVREPALQVLAEAQLRRINAVFEVLNDARRRADYDLTLHPGPVMSVELARRASVLKMTQAPRFDVPKSWIAVCIAVILLLAWGLQWGPSRAAGPVPSLEEAAKNSPGIPTLSPFLPSEVHSETAQELRQLRRELQSIRTAQLPAHAYSGQEAAFETTENPAVEFEPQSNGASGDSPAAFSRLAPLAAPSKPSPPASTATSPPSQSGLVGTWLYAQRASSTAKRDWYPPDFIELKIQSSPGGGIAGRYQARYRVGDLPISPEIRFRFQGDGDSMTWAGANGAQGEIRLKQTSPLTLLVDWNLTQPGDLPSLTSGSALLVKSPE